MVEEVGEQFIRQEEAKLQTETAVSSEREPIENIVEKVEKLGQVLKMPPQLIERGKRTEGYVVSPRVFRGEVEKHLRSLEALPTTEYGDPMLDEVAKLFGSSAQEIKDRRTKQVKQEIEKLGGISIPQENGKHCLVLINKGARLPRKLIVDHEIIHAMGDKGPGKKSGFQEPDGKHHGLNEGVIETLRIHAEHQDLPPDILHKKIKKGEIESPFPNEVQALLTAITATHLGNQPVTFKELAEAYAEEDGDFFKMDLVRRSHPDHRQTSKKVVTETFGF